MVAFASLMMGSAAHKADLAPRVAADAEEGCRCWSLTVRRGARYDARVPQAGID